MNTTHKLEVPLFKADIVFVHHVGWSKFFRQILDHYKDAGGFIAYEYGETIELEYAKGTTGRVVVTSNKDSEDLLFWFWAKEPEGQGDSDMGWLAHESYHLVAEILRNAGVKEGAASEEVYAYLLEWVMHKLVGIIWTHEQENIS